MKKLFCLIIILFASCSVQKEQKFVHKYNVQVHAEEEVINDTAYVTRMYANHETDSTYFDMIGAVEDNIQVILVVRTVNSCGSEVAYIFAYPQNQDELLLTLAIAIKQGLIEEKDLEPILETVVLLHDTVKELGLHTY